MATLTRPAPIARQLEQRAVPPLLRDIAAALLLLALTVLFYWRILTPNPINRGSFPKGDFVEQFYAFASFRARELVGGHLPLWNPYVYAGHPFVADIQSGVFYPLSWITTALAGPQGYPFFALEVEAIVHIFLAAFWMYLLARQISGNRVAGLVGGCVYAFGGYLSAYPSQQLSVLEVQTWLPLVLFWVHRATSRPEAGSWQPLGSAILGGLTLGTAILAGHPQASLYVVYAVSAYFVFRLLAATGWARRAEALRRWYLPAALLVFGFGTASVQLLPTIEFMGISSRSQIPYEMSGWAFPLRDIFQILLPGSVSLYSPMYVGILPLALGIGAVVWQRNRESGFWVGLAIVSLLMSFGGNTILHSVLYNLAPGFGVFRHQERGIVLFSLAMAALAAIGTSCLLQAGNDRLERFGWTLFRGFLAATGLYVVFFAASLSLEQTPPVQNSAALLVILLALSALLVVARRWGLNRTIFATFLVAIVAYDVITAGWQINFEKTQPGEQYRPTEIQKYLQRNDDKGRTHNDWQYPLNYGDVLRIRDVNGASPLIVERYRRLFNSEPRERVWRILGVKFFVTWQGGYEGGEKVSVEKAAGDREINLYSLPDPLPRAYVAHNATVIADDDRALRTLLAANFDAGATAVLAADPPIAPSGQARRSVATVRDISTDRLVVNTTIDSPGILILSEVYYPGWRVNVNGASAELLRAHFTLRGVSLPAGSHEVEFVFDPLSLKVGAAISIVTILTALLGLIAVKAAGTGRWRQPVDSENSKPRG